MRIDSLSICRSWLFFWIFFHKNFCSDFLFYLRLHKTTNNFSVFLIPCIKVNIIINRYVWKKNSVDSYISKTQEKSQWIAHHHKTVDYKISHTKKKKEGKKQISKCNSWELIYEHSADLWSSVQSCCCWSCVCCNYGHRLLVVLSTISCF